MSSYNWEDTVRQELNNLLDKILPISDDGRWAVKYKHPPLEKYEDGSIKEDTTKCSGACLYIEFDFKNNYNIDLL